MSKKFQICGASVIIFKDKRILLQQRMDNKCWGYHGGCVELGENVEDAAKRELYEETNLIANKLELYGVFSGPEQHHIYSDGSEAYIIDIVYLCNNFSGELHKQDEEVAELKWFDMNALPEKLSPSIKSTLIKFCNEQLKNKNFYK